MNDIELGQYKIRVNGDRAAAFSRNQLIFEGDRDRITHLVIRQQIADFPRAACFIPEAGEIYSNPQWQSLPPSVQDLARSPTDGSVFRAIGDCLLWGDRLPSPVNGMLFHCQQISQENA